MTDVTRPLLKTPLPALLGRYSAVIRPLLKTPLLALLGRYSAVTQPLLGREGRRERP